jgi:hypothetical protein
MRTNKQRTSSREYQGSGLPMVAGYEIDAAGGVFRYRNHRGIEVETVPMLSVRGQELLVRLSQAELGRAYARIRCSIWPLDGVLSGGAQ